MKARIIKNQRLIDAPAGLFLYDGTLCLKTEYSSGMGYVEAYIVDSGEFFCGDVETGEERNNLMVTPLDYEIQIDKAVICEPGKKHIYFISYYYAQANKTGFGHTHIKRTNRISTDSDVSELREFISEENNFDNCVILNFIELDPIM